MNSDLMVTVVLIVYNHEKYLRQAIESILSQKTEYSFEVLVHDDASTDSSLEIIKEYVDKYPDKVKAVLEKENVMSRTGNFCKETFFDEIRGKYLMFLEGDDYWNNDSKIQKQVDFLENNEQYAMCAGNTITYNCDNGVMGSCKKSYPDIDITVLDFLEGNAGFHTSSTCFRSERMLNIYRDFINNGKRISDLISLLVILNQGGKIRRFGDIFSVYRWHSVPTSHTSTYTRHEQMMFSLEAYNSFNEYTEYKYFDIVLLGIRNCLYELYGYGFLDLLKRKYLRRRFKTYSFIHKCGQLYRMLILRQKVAY